MQQFWPAGILYPACDVMNGCAQPVYKIPFLVFVKKKIDAVAIT